MVDTQDGEGTEARSETTTGLRDIIERTLMLGLGAAALTKDRVQAVADEFIRRGQLSADDGKDLVESLASRSREEARSALKTADSSLQTVWRELGAASRRDVEDLDFRLRQIEHRLALAEKVLDRSSDPTPDD